MGLFEYHTRYSAIRLHKKSQSKLMFHGLKWLMKLPLIALIIIAFFLLPEATGKNSLATNINHQPPWPYININGQADNIIANDQDGSFFIAIDNYIHRYSNELKLLSITNKDRALSLTTSSKVTPPYNESSNELLLLTKRHMLLSCWRTKDLSLICWLNKADDLTASITLKWPNENKGFKTDLGDHMRALVRSGDKNDDDLLIVTSRLKPVELEAQNSRLPYLPAVSRFKISKSNFALELKSVLPYKYRLSDSNLMYDYIYLFNYNNHTHFILNDIRKPLITSSSKESYHKVRIARICNNDMELTSYTEISLTCNNQNNLIAKYAYLKSSKEEPTLYIIFEETDEFNSVSKKTGERSLLCSYSMSLIDDLFYKAILDCNNGKQNSNLLAKLTDSDRVPPCQSNPSKSEEWCTSKQNPYIDGNTYLYNVREDTHTILDGIASINFLYITKQGLDMKDIIFIGTESGHLTKMNFDEDLFYTINFNNKQIKNYHIGEKFKSRTTYDSNDLGKITRYAVNSNNITAVSPDGSVNQLNINACYFYTTCKACLTTQDPLECVWCGSTCSRKQDCNPEDRSTLSCPPLIRNFEPKSGPISGWSRLRISGENFGSSRGNLTVKLGEQSCIVDDKLTSAEMIECITEPVSQPRNATISIDILDESGIIYSKGSTSSIIPFKYVKVLVFGLHPTSGPQEGGSIINVFGENLDAGSNRSVYIGDLECVIKDYQVDKISCLATAPPKSNTSKVNDTLSMTKNLRLIVDGIEQLLVPRPYFGEYNLSANYVYKNQSRTVDTNDSAITIDGIIPKSEGNSHIILLVIVVLVIILTVLFYLVRNDRIPQVKIKMPSAFESNDDKITDMKVSFRNPQSQKFAHSSPAIGGTGSMNGLVKLNGSMMSSDYFGKRDMHNQIEQDRPLMDSFLDNEMLTLLVQEKILIDRNKLTLGHVLGSGQFGRVYKGFLKVEATGEHAAVAVKTLHNRSSWDDTLDNRAFLEEGLMMKDFEHENVLALIGVTFDSNNLPMVITPFMLYGDLRSYISDEASNPTVKELIDFGTQVANGMAYLSNLKFVHRDLAARNCMLDDNLTVKVADFGLSRDIYERDYYSSDNKKTKLPVKWMAIESLEKCIYNTKTDVWSYGVLLWELMTRGVVPYPDVDNFDLFSYLKEGRRMLRPAYCPLILYKIMLSCWDENPANRPTFDELVQKVSDVITQLKIAKDGQQKVSKDMTYCDVTMI